MAKEYILGEGVFSLGSTPVALTRGGGKFVVEREYKRIQADGDYGTVKGRVRKDMSVAKLTLNALEILEANLVKFYPATQLDTTTVVKTATLTAKDDVADADYQTAVSWAGVTATGKQVKITLSNAINLENIDWSMVDKDEVVAQIVYEACYDETTRTTEPWKLDYVTP